MSDIAIIVAAGSGTRMNVNKNKLLLNLDGKTVIERTVDTFVKSPLIDEIIVVIKESELETMSELLTNDNISFVFGGKTRQESVMNALETIDECDYVIIHDGARPLVTEKIIENTLLAAKETGAAATGVPVKDTIKVVDENRVITSTPNRNNLVSIQTPQIFEFDTYLRAVEKAKSENKDFTDDCALVENLGLKVTVTAGEYSNIKITTPDDIALGELILKGGK